MLFIYVVCVTYRYFYSDWLADNVSLSASLSQYLPLHFLMLSHNVLQSVYLSHFLFSLNLGFFGCF